MSRIATLLHRIARLVEFVTAVPLVAAGAVMVGVVLAATFFRYVLNDPLTWSEELARYLMIWIGLVGASVTLRHGEHIRITAIRNLLPRPLRLIGDLFVAGAIGWFLWVMMIEGWAAAERGGRQMSPALGISMLWPLLAVPVAGALMLVQHVIQTLLLLMGAQNEPEHESPMGGGPI
ncbi:TRAP transporter small permease [Alkalilacustris brevis]|uniref:TRAP transporter small permease n=1 Tax=Alkalilacustris brevis TaxID=2026338 RepID=UPI000E0DC2AE|nr:TRAP transporter small permease [Alkalilacustris brevis]